MAEELGKTGKLVQKVSGAAVWPLKKLIGVLTTFVLALAFLCWLGAFVLEKVTGIETLPQFLAPARHTEREQLVDDQRECVMYEVLVEEKAAGVQSTVLDKKLIQSVLNHSDVYHTSPCVILYTMRMLVAVGDVRAGVPDREEWYLLAEFSFATQRKRELRVLVDDVQAHPDPAWKATHFIRPDRKRTLGNQTDAEKKRLYETLDSIPIPQVRGPDGKMINDPLEGGFQFFKPKTN